MPRMTMTLVLALLPTAGLAQTEITLTAADGVTLFADQYMHEGNRLRGTILLFHQADSNAAEYADIAPRLAALGFDALALDQRSGGNLFMGTNRTVATLGLRAGYEAALPDLQAAVDHAVATSPDAPLLIWGSSYSAALVLVIAGQNPETVDAILSFSPGEYFSAINVAEAAELVRIPTYLTASGTDAEMAEVIAISAAMEPGLVTIDDPKAGRHGSSTLREASNPGGWAENWVPVEAFLTEVAP